MTDSIAPTVTAPRADVRITFYTPDDRRKTGLFASLFQMARNVYLYRAMILRLFLRDFLAGHRKSYLGMAWVVLTPFLSVVTWVFMNASGLLNPGQMRVSYPAFLLVGTTLWTLFLGFYTSAALTLSAGQGIILQVKYPHEALLAKQSLEPLANFAITFVLVLALLFAFGVTPSPATLLLPVAILPLFFLGASLGLLAGLVGVVAAEAKKVMDLAMGVVLFVTPVIYSSRSRSPLLDVVTRWNPLTYLLAGVRDLILFGQMDSLATYGWVALGSFVFFLISLRLFYLTEDRVIEKIL